jgi:hypothetical protein
MEASMEVARVGIVTESLGEDDTAELRFAILALNRLQNFCEFEITHFFDQNSTIFKELSTDRVLDRRKIVDLGQGFVDYIESFAKSNMYDASSYPCGRYVILSKASFSDKYYLVQSNSKLRILALGDWKRHFYPPSLLEFIVDSCLKQGIREAYGGIDSHLNSRGCAFDFNAVLSNTRNGVLIGCLCHDCRVLLSEKNSEWLPEIESLLGGGWLGSAEDPRSILSGLHRMGYSPFMSRGVRRRPIDWIKEKVAEPFVSEVIKIIVLGIALYLSLRLGLNELVSKL